MAGFLPPVIATLVADTKQFTAGMGKARQEMNATADNGTTSFKKLGTSLAVGGAATVAFAAIVGRGLLSAAHAYGESEAATLKLQNTIRNEPQLAGASAAAFDQLAHHISEVTRVSHIEATEAESLLGQYHLTQAQIQTLLPLIADLSVKMGISLAQAAKIVGKEVETGSNSLKKYGIDISSTSLKADAFGAVVKGLSRTVGGFAEEEGKTFSGRLAILHNQLNDLKENVGKGVVEAYSKALDPVVALSNALANSSAKTQETIGSFIAMGTVVVGAAGGLASFAGGVVNLKEAFTVAEGATGVFGTSLTGMGAAAVGVTATVAALGAAYIIFTRHSREVKKATDDIVTAVKTEGKTVAEVTSGKLADWISQHEKEKKTLDAAGISIKDYFKAFTDGETYDKVTARLKDYIASTSGASLKGTQQLSTLTSNLKLSRDAQANATKELKLSKEATDQLNTSSAKASSNARQWAIDWRAYARSVTDVRGAITDLHNAELDINDSERSMHDALRNQVAALLDVRDRQHEYTQAVKEHGPQSEEAIRAALGLAAAQEGVGAASDNAKRSIIDLAAKQSDYQVGAQNSGQATQAFILHLHDLETGLDPSSPLLKWLVNYVTQLRNIPTDIHTRVSADSAGVSTRGFKTSAGGNDLAPGEWSIVGEKGPELFRAGSAGGHVFPHQSASAARPSGGGAGGVVVNIDARGTVGLDLDALGRVTYEALARVDKRNGGLKLRVNV